jgi:hypothetical protein
MIELRASRAGRRNRRNPTEESTSAATDAMIGWFPPPDEHFLCDGLVQAVVGSSPIAHPRWKGPITGAFLPDRRRFDL